MAVENLGLGAFRRALNMRADGSFATSIEKTKGNLYVTGNGVLKSANRHFNTVQTDPTANADARSQLLSALESASPGAKSGAQLKFLKRIRVQLGLADNHELSRQPLSRRDVKQIITEFDAIVRNEQKTRAALKDVVNKLDGMPEDWVVTATANGKVDFAPPEAGAGRDADLNRRLAQLLLEVLRLSDSHDDVAKKAAELLGLTNDETRRVPPVTVETILKLKVLAAHAKDYHDAYVSFVQSGKPDAAERAMKHVEQQVQDDVRREAEAREGRQIARQCVAATYVKLDHGQKMTIPEYMKTLQTEAFNNLDLACKAVVCDEMSSPDLGKGDDDKMENLRLYQEFLDEREGDGVSALYDFMKARGVDEKNLKPRYDYSKLKQKPRNRAEELEYSSALIQTGEDNLEFDENGVLKGGNLNINDVQEKMEDIEKHSPATWQTEKVLVKKETLSVQTLLVRCKGNLTKLRHLDQQSRLPPPVENKPAPEEIVNDDNNIINENW